jgi:DNA repair photolyase
MWDSQAPAVASFDKIKQKLINPGRTKAGRLIASGVPVRLGGMTDCFMPQEEKIGLTWQVINLLEQLAHPYLILTKSPLVATPLYTEIMSPSLAYIQISITGLDSELVAQIEPGCQSTEERLEAVRTLASAGFFVAVRINPLFPIFPDGHYSHSLLSLQKPLPLFSEDLVDRIADAGASTIIAGFLRLSSWNIRWIKKATGLDLTYLFSAKATNQALHYGSEEKRIYYERLAELCKACGVAFSICYDEDDAYEEFQYLWANQNDCCNGLGNVLGFTKTAIF